MKLSSAVAMLVFTFVIIVVLSAKAKKVLAGMTTQVDIEG